MTRISHRFSNQFLLVGFLLAGSVVVAACSSSAPTASDVSTEVGLSALAEEPGEIEGLQLLAHRGMHQTFDRAGVDDETCTATRIHPPVHEYLENTLASMGAAFAAGAAVVEIDIAPTSDGVLAVFHDWDVGCRTEGTGEIRSLTWDESSKLDVGYGYTVDGETYPLRGRGVGLMPRLEDVFDAFPEGQFLINFKSNDPSEAVLLQQVVERKSAADQVWAVYGAQTAVRTYVSNTETRGFSEASIRACLAEYLAAESSASTLDACIDTVVVVPSDIAPLLTGWPNDFIETMARHGTHVVISGPNGTGIDTKADLDNLPNDIDAYVWTDRVDAIT